VPGFSDETVTAVADPIFLSGMWDNKTDDIRMVRDYDPVTLGLFDP
jgi:hypothetical protein